MLSQRSTTAQRTCVTRSPLNATLLAWTASVVGNRRDIFNQLDLQASRLQCGDRILSSTAGPFNTNLDLANAELLSFLSTLLSSHLSCEWRTLTAPLETTRSSAGPTECFTFRVGDRYRRIVEGCVNMGDARDHVPSLLFFRFYFRHFDFFTRLSDIRSMSVNTTVMKEATSEWNELFSGATRRQN